MLTLTLAGNNLEWNSQCRCSVVAKWARYTGVYIGGGGGDLKITRSWSQFYCAPLFTVLSYSYKCLLQNRKVIPDHPPPPSNFLNVCPCRYI
jgi:hypothetical protein